MDFQSVDINNLPNQKQRLHRIHDAESFRYFLERERALAERSGHTFSLVLFGLDRAKANGASLLEHLGDLLVKKVRITDEVGWYDDGKTIGTLLSGTTAEGAWRFIDIIMQKIGREGNSLIGAVYTYPDPEKGLANHEDPSRGTGDERGTDKCNDARSSPVAARSIEVLFARPNPPWKRALDFVAAILLLVVLSPLFLLIALFIKIVSPGPVLYTQQRIGFLGNPFTFWKFRTMHVGSDPRGHRQYLNHLIESDSPMTKLDEGNDDRIIPFGKFLRYSCLDELPQLINVLKGEMSLVGPRPCLPYEAQNYLKWHTRRFDTVPGMTGLWQVSGKNRTTFNEMIRLDIRYSRTMSPIHDTKILLLTAPAILGMVSQPLARKMALDRDAAAVSPSGREQAVRG